MIECSSQLKKITIGVYNLKLFHLVCVIKRIKLSLENQL